MARPAVGAGCGSPARSGRRATPRGRWTRRRRGRTGSCRRGSRSRRGRSARRRSTSGRSPARSIRFSLSSAKNADRAPVRRPERQAGALVPGSDAALDLARAGGPTASGTRPGRRRTPRVARPGTARPTDRRVGAVAISKRHRRQDRRAPVRVLAPRPRSRPRRRARARPAARAAAARAIAAGGGGGGGRRVQAIGDPSSSPVDIARCSASAARDPSRGSGGARDRAADARRRCARSAAARWTQIAAITISAVVPSNALRPASIS